MKKIRFQNGKTVEIDSYNELINSDMLIQLGFWRNGDTDESFTHILLEARSMNLDFFDGAYHFVVFETSQGIGQMHTIWELLEGFQFVTTKNLTSIPNQYNENKKQNRV